MKGLRNIGRKERQPVTRVIKNCRVSSLFKGCSPLQLSCDLTGKYHTIGYYSYTQR